MLTCVGFRCGLTAIANLVRFFSVSCVCFTDVVFICVEEAKFRGKLPVTGGTVFL